MSMRSLCFSIPFAWPEQFPDFGISSRQQKRLPFLHGLEVLQNEFSFLDLKMEFFLAAGSICRRSWSFQQKLPQTNTQPEHLPLDRFSAIYWMDSPAFLHFSDPRLLWQQKICIYSSKKAESELIQSSWSFCFCH